MAIQQFQVGIKALIRNTSGQILMVHIPAWNHNPAHWDLPGGRIDEGESFLDTLKRELHEEIGVGYTGTPKQLDTFLTKITIPDGNKLVPLIFVIYDVSIAADAVIKLDPESAEDEYDWFDPKTAAKNMTVKFTDEFCEYIRGLD